MRARLIIQVQLCDFGIAYQTAGRSFTFCGTPEYIAPEVRPSAGSL